MDQLVAEASHRMDELVDTLEHSSDRGPLEPEDSATLPPRKPARQAPAATASEPAPATARFGRPQSSGPRSKSDQSHSLINPNRRVPPPIAPRSKGPGEARMRQIYETVAKSLKKMVPQLDRKYKGKRVDFKVVVKDGKVGIKPVVKK
jgi:hypothetical protein